MSSPKCRHARKGIVTNQATGYDDARPHAATVVCDRAECIRDAQLWVAGLTNETAVYVSDASRVKA